MIDDRYKIIKEYLDSTLTCSAHNLDHVMRVYNTSLFIAKKEEQVDLEILIPAALLHDIARVKESEDTTGEIDHAVLGAEMAEKFLNEIGYDKSKVKAIKHCILTHRYRTGNIPTTIEAKILFDADKLDAIGNIGIARTFMLSGQSGQRIKTDEKLEDYIARNIVENGRIKDLSEHTPFIEYEYKLKKIPKKLYTKTAKQIAEKRIENMDLFFEILKAEIDGDLLI